MKKIVIIGGGIAGLSAGIFAQKNGFQSIIIEKHHTLGGECTGWDRQGYHIDGCIHWLVGTKKGTEFHTLWETVGAFEGVDIYHPESFMVVEYGGITVPFYRELDRFQDSWLSISPKDVDSINELCRDIKVLQAFSMPAGKPLDMMGITEKLKHLLSLKDIGPVYNKYSKMSIAQFAAKFTHPALSTAIKSFMPEGDYSAISLVFPIATFTSGQSSIPLGGSRALANRMVNKYVELGGTVKTSCEIKDLEITDNRVVKAICEQEQSFEADYFVAACDAKVLFERLLKGRYPDPQFEKRYNNPTIYPLASNIYVGIGYEGTLEGTPRTLKFPVASIDIKQNGKPIDYLQMTHYSYEPDFAPEGHTAITFAINQFEPELEFWENLALDRERYSKEKARVGQAVITGMLERFPHMAGKIKLLDVATPHTYNRYCNAYRGAFMGFWPTLKGKSMEHTGRIRGLENLWLSGQWLQPPGGLPNAVLTGKNTLMRICKQEKRVFTL